jgi:hypothetical protein
VWKEGRWKKNETLQKKFIKLFLTPREVLWAFFYIKKTIDGGKVSIIIK